MPKSRKAKFIIATGVPGTGKSTVLRQLLQANQRNLIIPASVNDDAFSKVKAINPSFEWITDPNDFNQKRKIKKWSIPSVNGFRGSRLVNLREFTSQEDMDSLFDSVCAEVSCFKNGGLFIDDFKNYIKSKGTLKYNVGVMFRARRHRMIDIFMACHSLQDVNSEMIQFGCEFLIFKTNLAPNKNMLSKIANSRELLACIARVNKAAQKDPYYFERFQVA